MSGLVISAHDVDAFEQSLMEYMDRVDAVRRQAQAEVLGDLRARAASLPAWEGIHFDTWDEFDRSWIGVRGNEYASQAEAAEYGTEDQAPASLMRTLDASLMRAAQRAGGQLASYYGGF